MGTDDRSQTESIVFKQCSTCTFNWTTRDRFLGDPDIEVIGYQVNFERLLAGFFLFNHACGTTLAILTKDFEDLYDGPVFKERATGSEACPGYCLHQNELGPCPVQCECAFVREIIQRINDWPKRRKGVFHKP